MKYFRSVYSFFLITLCVFAAGSVSAATSISSFSASPSLVSSGGMVSLNWTGQESSGANLLISCADGVKIKQSDGTVLPCGSRVNISSQASDSQGLFAVNTSGSQKSVTFTLFPRDISGTEVSSGSSQTVSIATMPYPIDSVTFATSTTAGNKITTISWAASQLDGVNLMISCVSGVTFTADSGGAPLPCGQLLYTSKLLPSSAQSFMFTNKNTDVQYVVATVLPYITDGAYDLTHAQTLSVPVTSDTVVPSKIKTFYATRPNVASDDTFSLVWDVQYVPAVNIKMDCADGVSLYFANSTTSGALPCNSPIIPGGAFGATASTSLVLHNTGTKYQNITFTLLPGFAAGGFDGINVRTVSMTVSPQGQSSLVDTSGATQTTQTQVGTSLSTTGTGGNTVIGKLTRALSLGSRNAEVTILQKILARDKDVYPSGTVTGYFGPATRDAVQRFQVKYGIAKKGSNGYGSVGPATRAKLNSL